MMRAVKKLAPLRCPKLHMTRPQGNHVHPNSEHLASLAECFLSSAATAADPAVRPASEIKVGLSGDTTVRSKAAGLPQSHVEARMSAGRVFRSSCPSPLPASALTLMQACTMAGLKHYIPELVVPGYSITTSLTCYCMVA
eukprot:Em0758g1a